MAFYNDFGKKLSQTKDEAAKKARNFSEITRLNSSISELEREITAAYTEIGRITYQKFADSPEDADADFIPLLQKISDKMSEAEEHHKRIMELKGLKKCIKCGREISVNTAFCNFCGERQIPEVKFEEGTGRCPKCGTPYAAGQLFCMSCGSRLEEPAESIEETAAAAIPEEVSSQDSNAEGFYTEVLQTADPQSEKDIDGQN